MSANPPQRRLEGADRLALLYRLSQTFNSTLDLDQVLNKVMDEVIVATRAERGFLMLKDDGGRLSFRAARGLDQSTIEQPEFQVSRGILQRVAQEGQPLLTSNAQDEAWLSGRQSVIVLGLRSVLCVPIRARSEQIGQTHLIGVIYVDNHFQVGIFTQDDLDLLSAISASAAIAIENARLYALAVEKGRMERELQVARELQAALLPQAPPDLPGWEFAARWRPARQVAGDFYDFIPSQDGLLRLVVADVADKGIPAALFMALTRSNLRASLFGASEPLEGITQANRLVCADSSAAMFVTLFVAQIDPRSGELLYVNAGHNPPLHYRAADDTFVSLARTGMALGVDEAARYEQRAVRLAPGDFLVLYTDGVSEAFNPQGQPFGESRLRRLLADLRRAPAPRIVDAILDEIEAFTGRQELDDDITLLIARRLAGS